MKAHENILVFYKKLPTYNPQMTSGHRPTNTSKKSVETQNKGGIYGKATRQVESGGSTVRYPRSVLTFPSDKQKECLHPTQKPLALCEYLVKTYTNEKDIVFDSCIGSGTTPVACVNTNRRYLGFEKDEAFFSVAKKRIEKAEKNVMNLIQVA